MVAGLGEDAGRIQCTHVVVSWFQIENAHKSLKLALKFVEELCARDIFVAIVTLLQQKIKFHVSKKCPVPSELMDLFHAVVRSSKRAPKAIDKLLRVVPRDQRSACIAEALASGRLSDAARRWTDGMPLAECEILISSSEIELVRAASNEILKQTTTKLELSLRSANNKIAELTEKIEGLEHHRDEQRRNRGRCMYFSQGKGCQYGDFCYFSHEVN